MTRKKFIKFLRRVGTSERVIKSYIKLIAQFGGAQSYQSVYDAISQSIINRILYAYPSIEFDDRYKLQFNLNADFWQHKIFPTYDVKPLEYSAVVRAVKEIDYDSKRT